jgi:hypothetical protein
LEWLYLVRIKYLLNNRLLIIKTNKILILSLILSLTLSLIKGQLKNIK